MKSIILTLFAMLSLNACGTKQSDNNKTMNNGKSIVVFFSHAGENYSVGNIEEGNTKLVADIICEQTGADRLEIICLKDYNMTYNALCDLAKEEQQKDELPDFTLMMNGEPVEGTVNFDDYAIVYIGGPVWWGTYPQVMFSFFKQYDLNDKTILPFTTHEGSGLGSCVSDLKKIYSKATFGKAFSLYGHEVRTEAGRKKVEKWIK